MDDLVAFLRARLAEDEAVARAVEDRSAPWDGQWVADGPDALRTRNGHVLAYGHRTTDGRDLPIPLKPKLAAHWARHDPARVLREVEAKRRIVERYAWLREHGDTGGAAWVLPLLAAAYADHPDYRPEWAPTD